MEHDMTDDLERRLHGSRPRTAGVDENAFDAELLAHVRDLPIAARRSVPRAVALPVAAGVTLTATAFVMLGGGPGEVGGPSSASAITQALHWLTPPPGSILHATSVETSGTRTTTREIWQSADDPATERQVVEGPNGYETAGGALYDPATDTIYDATAPKPAPDDPGVAKAEAKAKAKVASGEKVLPAGAPGGGKPGDQSLPSGDPVVTKVRILLQAVDMEVSGREVHNGTEAWAISLKPDAGRPIWTLWVDASDGKPLELRDPGRDANEAPQVIRWPAYEVLNAPVNADQLLTLTGAHPSARVDHDPADAAAAEQRLLRTKTA